MRRFKQMERAFIELLDMLSDCETLTFTPADRREFEKLAGLDVKKRIVSSVRDGAKTAREIAASLEEDERLVQVSITELNKAKKIRSTGFKRERKKGPPSFLWGAA